MSAVAPDAQSRDLLCFLSSSNHVLNLCTKKRGFDGVKGPRQKYISHLCSRNYTAGVFDGLSALCSFSPPEQPFCQGQTRLFQSEMSITDSIKLLLLQKRMPKREGRSSSTNYDHFQNSSGLRL
jgi:hypothetical protein